MFKEVILKNITLVFPGTKVTQVSAVDNENDGILYEINADAAGKFNLNQSTGWITSNVVIDREVFYIYIQLMQSHVSLDKFYRPGVY